MADKLSCRRDARDLIAMWKNGVSVEECAALLWYDQPVIQAAYDQLERILEDYLSNQDALVDEHPRRG